MCNFMKEISLTDGNKMKPDNLSLCFAPNVLHAKVVSKIDI